ncbi:MAG: GspH/FimT family pseudopilin [Pseudomonadota bacterium]
MIAVSRKYTAIGGKSRAGGYTVLELMLAVAIVAIVAGFAVPSFLSTIRANRTVTINNELVSALTLARSEAIKRGNRVTVCPTADQVSCLAGGTWESGWIVFDDPAGAGAVDSGETILRVWEAATGGTTIRAAASFSDFVSFVGSGETRATPSNTDSFYVCNQEGELANGRTITVGVIGYAKTQKGAAACP